jgi:predicted ATPase
MVLAIGSMFKGAALVEQGHTEDGLAALQQGGSALQAIGTRIFNSIFLIMLAHAYDVLGQTEKGLAVIAEAEAFLSETGERGYEAELYRLKGELTLQQENQKSKGKEQKAKVENDAQAEAESCFRKAIDIAQKQQAKSWELRASTSLARLWQSQGKQAEAHTLLSEVYHWFTEGFDTKDLQEAKALLEELT